MPIDSAIRCSPDRAVGAGRRALLLVLLGLCVFNRSSAAESFVDQFRINGFGTAGIAHLNSPSGWGYQRDISQPYDGASTRVDLDSRIGLQINYTPGEQVEAVVQALLSRRAEASTAGDRIALAFLAYRPDADWTVRAGRVNFDAYLLSDHRDVGFTYLFARPPTEFYSQLPTYLNGADVSRVWNDSGALWRVKAVAGSTAGISASDRIAVRPVFGLVVSHEAGSLLLRASLVQGRLGNAPVELQPLTRALDQISLLPSPMVSAEAASLQSHLKFRGVDVTYASLGAEYDRGVWMWSGEFTHLSGIRGFHAGYASLGRHVGPVTLFGLVSAVASTQSVATAPRWDEELKPILGPAAAQQVQYLAIAAAGAVNDFSSRQHTSSLGVRWDLTAQVALKTQWDYITVDADGSSLWTNRSLQAAHANVMSLLVDFVF